MEGATSCWLAGDGGCSPQENLRVSSPHQATVCGRVSTTLLDAGSPSDCVLYRATGWGKGSFSRLHTHIYATGALLCTGLHTACRCLHREATNSVCVPKHRRLCHPFTCYTYTAWPQKPSAPAVTSHPQRCELRGTRTSKPQPRTRPSSLAMRTPPAVQRASSGAAGASR
jgi:hypothetical protein